MGGDLGEKVGGRRLADSLRASSGVAELLTRLVTFPFLTILELGTAIQVREYTVHVDYAHIRENADADAAENLIHINHIYVNILQKELFLGQKIGQKL